MTRVFSNFQSDEIDYTKKICVDHIYNSINISQFKYELLEFMPQLSQFFEKKYYVSVNFSGSNCLLVFSKIKDKYYQFLIDRKTLSYNSSKINYNSVKLNFVDIKLDIGIYKDSGTIFDGVFIQNNGKKTFIITDAYLFKGQEMINTTINAKLLTICTYFQSVYKANKNNDLTILINDIYECKKKEVSNLVHNIIPNNNEFLIKGICFYPEFSSTKLILMFDNKDKEKDKEIEICKKMIVKERVEIEQPIIKKQEVKYIPQKGKNYVFEMKRTPIIDVYNLNIAEPTNKNGKTLLKRIKIGIAYIGGIEKSKWCNDIMEKYNGSVLVNCIYHPDKYKYEPFEISKSTKPSLTTDFDII